MIPAPHARKAKRESQQIHLQRPNPSQLPVLATPSQHPTRNTPRASKYTRMLRHTLSQRHALATPETAVTSHRTVRHAQTYTIVTPLPRQATRESRQLLATPCTRYAFVTPHMSPLRCTQAHPPLLARSCNAATHAVCQNDRRCE